MKLAKVIFYVAGIYGLLVLTPILFMEARIGIETPPAITHPEYFYGFVSVGIAWQVAFLVIARDPLRYRMMMLPSMLEKFGFGAAAICLYTQSRLSGQVLTGAMIDILLGAAFVAAFVASGRAQSGNA